MEVAIISKAIEVAIIWKAIEVATICEHHRDSDEVLPNIQLVNWEAHNMEKIIVCDLTADIADWRG